jgi:catechol 2,3-dioxygenase-like lactoylglutathione lyase family enzyme
MIRTYGLTHLALHVSDFERSIRFYNVLFGMKVTYRKPNFVQIETPGNHDVIVLQQNQDVTGKTGDIIHFGFRLPDRSQVEEIPSLVEKAGGTVTSQGEFAPGVPYVFLRDPDGYEIEIWYEP